MTGGVLLTGASGLVGVEVAARLEASGVPVTAVLHAARGLVGNDGAPRTVTRQVVGDVQLPGFGLDAAVAGETSLIVHCAATTAFDATDEEYRRLNVAGAEHAVELALAWDVPLVHVSTAYVCGLRGGRVLEDELDVGQEFGNRYERSKFHAEQIIGAARDRGLRAAVVRPGIVSGASADGTIRDHKNLYTVVKLMVEGKLRTLPGRYDATLSLAPVDHVADVIAAVAGRFHDGRGADVEGRTFHALGADVLTLRELSDVLAEYPSFAVARFVPESSFDDGALDRLEREYYRRVGSLYTSYFARKLDFCTENSDALLGRAAPPSGPEYLRTLLDHSLEVGYLGAPLTSIGDVLAAVRGSR
ncbi:SDR family oxidoreductase [Tsukamurella sp. 1534]|uniref:SDR family oxidoreductase n=1 Tax=Tsukamurella sp. 1534 TaxID=1151061 RepID=UPI00031D07AE|nr:SDR family oxidoreductase [Tsukamurella sp. 1534]